MQPRGTAPAGFCWPFDHLVAPSCLLRFYTSEPVVIPVPFQVRKTAHQMGVLMSGENALPCISPGGVDTTALERIIRNTTAYDPASTPPPLTWGSFAPSSVSMQQLRGSVASFSSNSSMSSCGDVCTESSIATETDQCVLPAMRSFTFLRLNQEMISPAYQVSSLHPLVLSRLLLRDYW